MASDELTLWKPNAPVTIPPDVDGAQIAAYARQLSARERQQIEYAFTSGSYEMGTSFLWKKAMDGLRRQLASLGMEFVGEMLDRNDITADSSIQHVVTDYEALTLAEELGMFNTTQTMRLRQAMEMVNHFADPPEDVPDDEVMTRSDASQVLRACVQGVLGHERLEGAVEFAEFRRNLENRGFKPNDEEIESLIASPYFFRRTTLRVLLSLIKTAQSAQLEHALANANVIIPLFWPGLMGPERSLVGRVYAEVHSSGKRTAVRGLRRALQKVHGFDYVPEDLRSRTFIAAAQKLLEAHFGGNNYYNEPKPMKNLARLGTVIPVPALPKCMSAILCVYLGNQWGHCWAAQDDAKSMLDSIGDDRWIYYLRDCLPGDDMILPKLMDSNIVPRWITLAQERGFGDFEVGNSAIDRLVTASVAAKVRVVISYARKLYGQIRSS